MARIIIDYPDDMPPERALDYARVHVGQGRISVADGIPHFCWLSSFGTGVEVHTRRKKKEQTSDSLFITKGP